MGEVKVALIGGSGAYELARECWGREIGVEVLKTPFGDSAPLHLFVASAGVRFLFLSRHGEDGYRISAPFVNYRANVWALKMKGVEKIIAWSGPGAIRWDYEPGDFILPHDLIDFTKSRKNTFFEKRGLGFIRQQHPFCPQGRDELRSVLERAGLKFHPRGVYVCTEGPRLETAAEIRMFSTMGADMVGMTLVPEVFLARELEMCYTALCYVSNYAEGVKELAYDAGVLFEGTLPAGQSGRVRMALESISGVVPQLVDIFAATERRCSCAKAMLRYRKRADIGDDWRRWIE